MIPIGSSRPLTKPGDRFYWVERGVYIVLFFSLGTFFFILIAQGPNIWATVLSLIFFVPGGIILWASWIDEKNYLERGGFRKPLFGDNSKERPKPKVNPEYLRLENELRHLKKEIRRLRAKRIKVEFVVNLLQLAESFLMCSNYTDASKYLLMARTGIDERWAILKGREEKQTSQPKEVKSSIKATEDEDLIE